MKWVKKRYLFQFQRLVSERSVVLSLCTYITDIRSVSCGFASLRGTFELLVSSLHLSTWVFWGINVFQSNRFYFTVTRNVFLLYHVGILSNSNLWPSPGHMDELHLPNDSFSYCNYIHRGFKWHSGLPIHDFLSGNRCAPALNFSWVLCL